MEGDRNKHLLFRHLQKENAFWSYDPSFVKLENLKDEMFIEKVMLHLDIDDINRLFALYPKARIKKVWRTRLCPLEPYCNGLNRLFAYMYFDIKNPDRYIKAQRAKHIRELVK
ncbi:MAG: hypothetical protein LBL04_11745 [Bacteroidales bacterium]|nr:hypothetical protein [Bacteroidales bacterium]